MHFNPADSFYFQPGVDRIHYYPPPSYGYYMSPWLWYDGNQHGGMDNTIWEAMIVARMGQSAPVTVSIAGEYSATTDSGIVSATFRNDSTAEISGRVIIVITEDSLYYPAPNGVEWHNHVPRNYIPDYNGTLVTIPAGDSFTVTQPFATHPNWQKGQCRILTWLQNDVMQPDSTKEIWQGGMVKLMELGITENQSPNTCHNSITVIPNPCSQQASFLLNFKDGGSFSIRIFDASGRKLRTLTGKAISNRESVCWNLKDSNGSRVASGIYFYEFTTAKNNISGKIIVR